MRAIKYPQFPSLPCGKVGSCGSFLPMSLGGRCPFWKTERQNSSGKKPFAFSPSSCLESLCSHSVFTCSMRNRHYPHRTEEETEVERHELIFFKVMRLSSYTKT